MQPIAIDPERLRLIRAEQVKAFDQSLPSAIAFQLVASLIILIALWNTVSHSVMIGWFAALTATKAYRLVLSRGYRRSPDPVGEAERWARIFTTGRFASGVAWGSAAVLLYVPGSFASHAVISFSLIALAAGGITATTPFQATNYAFVIPTIAPLILRFAFERNFDYLWLALLALLFLGFILINGRAFHEMLVQSLKIRFENTDLIAELTRQKAAAEAANSAKTRFLAAASHDLRQPLFAIGLDASTLERRLANTESYSIAGRISRSVDALQAMFNELLDISKLDAGMVSSKTVAFPLQELLTRLEVDYGAQARDKGLGFKVRPWPGSVRSDAGLLDRILRNLVSNAVRYTQHGRILVACRRRGSAVRIEVWDTGPGIAETEQARVFEEFYQIDNPERDRSKGLGLGLAIVKRLAQLLGCSVQVRSHPGRGSVFSVVVPRAARPWVDLAPTQTTEVAEASLEGRVVVLVDDERDVRESMQSLLATWGCTVIAAPSTDDLLPLLRDSGARPELVIADYRLRNGITGTQVIARIRTEVGHTIPGMLITGDTAPDRLREAQSSGFMLLHKPLPPAGLRQAINQLLQIGTSLSEP